MEKTRRRAMVLGALALVTMLMGVWLVYQRFWGTPKGPELPPEPPKREYSKDVIELNNQAVELQGQDPQKALSLYDEAIGKDPKYYIAHTNKAQLLLSQKRYQEAAECLQVATSLRPRVAEYYVGRAFCLQRLGDTREAKRQLRCALSAYDYRIEEAENPWTRLNRALVLFLLGRRTLAEEEIKSVGLEPPDLSLASPASRLLKSMAEAAAGDPWSILGLD